MTTNLAVRSARRNPPGDGRYGLSIALFTSAILGLFAVTVRAELNAEQRSELLRSLSPIFISDGPNERPPVNPSFFVEGCRLRDAKAGGWVKAPGGGERWTANQLLDWLQAGGLAERSQHFEISPEGWRLQGTVREGKDRSRRSAELAIRDGHGVFGHVSPLGGDRYSVKYFLFLTWNETAYSGGEGNHEGDWLCLDLQVAATDPRQPNIIYALYHNHGRILLVEPSALELREGRPLAYLETGTNEPWPNRGGRGFGGHPRRGVRATKYWSKGEGLSSEHKVVREHRGQGLTYDTLNKVRNLETCRDLDCRLVLEYRGQSGEKDVDRFKAITGVNVTNPESPRWQAKMWDRAFTARPGDPRSDTIWLVPPKTEQDWGRR